ncbi:MAG TPA: zinc finger domain-containing protein, partial [Anaerolineales bacterium]|nr:zinc finger domain-containing protein [Anaerolineales bacterium]
DTRKFGRVWLVDDPEELFAGLGPEPLGDDFTPEWLFENLQTRSRQIKPLLLDQGFLAGVGNIYADESLHRAAIHPLRRSQTVSEPEARALWGHLRDVLHESINNNGASIDWVYRGGTFQNVFRVYGRTGEPCPNCGGVIEKIVVGQRGTHLCPNCQPAP